MTSHLYNNAPSKFRVCDIENFSGPISVQLQQFIRQKRSLGLKYEAEAYVLSMFDRFLQDSGAPQNRILKESVVGFCAKRPGESHKTFANRGSVIRGFGEYMGMMGYESYVLPYYTRHESSSFTPYIYTHNEIEKIFVELDKWQYTRRSPYAHKVYPMLFRVLYGCGLRISEALNLKIEHVDLKNGTFRLENTKCNSERLVFMSESLLKECRVYFNELNFAGESKYFFPSKTRGIISKYTVSTELKRVLRICEIPMQARVHDFRHTFSVHLLNRWFQEGKDINVCLPLLSKYLGHTKISATESYLRLTAEVYPEVTQIFEQYFGGVIPEVSFYEAH